VSPFPPFFRGYFLSRSSDTGETPAFPASACRERRRLARNQADHYARQHPVPITHSIEHVEIQFFPVLFDRCLETETDCNQRS